MLDAPLQSNSIPNAEIFNFDRFGDYLRHRIETKPQDGSTLSYRGLARQVQGASGQMLHAIAHGKRLPGQAVLLDLCKALDLSYTQSQFAEALVAFERAETPEERGHFANKLGHFRRDRYGSVLKDEMIDLLAETRSAAILELMKLHDFRSDPEWIAKRISPDLTGSDVSRILSRLESAGLVKWECGTLRRGDNALNATSGQSSEAIRRFHKDMLGHAILAVDQQSVDERGLYGVTMAVDTDKIPEAQRLIAKFCNEMAALMHVDPKKEVYHLSVQLFRLSTPSEDSHG